MEITRNGYSCFTIKTKNATIVTDPFDPEHTGLPLPELKADVVTISHDHKGHNNSQAVKGDPKVLDWPGEYDIKGVFVISMSTFHNAKEEEDKGINIVNNFFIEDMYVCHLGDIGHVLTTDHVDELGQVDILLVPVGEGNCINIKKAQEIIEKIEPRIVIPMHYAEPGLKRDDLKPVNDFFKEIGIANPEQMEVLKITKKDLPQEDTRYILLT
jgi:L-ascorbate metabolism protein UlaG (beta-lactamase superfamily)